MSRIQKSVATIVRNIKNYFIRRLSCISPELASRFLYWHKFGHKLNLSAPKTLNEKIIWLKLNIYKDSELVTQCSDKYRVREYVERCNCGDILNDLYGVWKSADEIDWGSLPLSFVLKCNHGSGFNLLVSDKSCVDEKWAKSTLDRWLCCEFWQEFAELQYRHIEKRIICEKYISPQAGLYDYKVYCFQGEPKYILVCIKRERENPRYYFFNTSWKFCAITRDGLHAPEGFTLPKPPHFGKMLEYAKCLSAPFPFVRVDFYDTECSLVFGELTFTPSAGLDTGRLSETDKMFGDMLLL